MRKNDGALMVGPACGRKPPACLGAASIAFTALLLSSCTASESTPDLLTEAASLQASSTQALAPRISSAPPADIEGGAPTASLYQAAIFSWEQMIAMNWPAEVQDGLVPVRGKAAGASADGAKGAPRVWQTLRAKTEVFAGTGAPHGSEQGAGSDFGYDQPPLYRYDPAAVGKYPGLEPGLVPACFKTRVEARVPWVELSETHEVGPEQMFSGSAPFKDPDERLDRQRVLFAVKVSRSFYSYVVANGWLEGGAEGSVIPAQATADYVAEHGSTPPPGTDQWVSFPAGSLQIKTAWRRLSAAELESGRYLTAWARAYQAQDPESNYEGVAGNPDYPCYVDGVWGLVGMHFKTRTESAPYYVWSTFEHVDNLVDASGEPVEDASGRFIGDPELPATDPEITARNAVAADPPTPDTIQKMWPANASAEPGRRLYYRNASGTPTTQGTIAVNRRQHPIPDPVIAANAAAHQQIEAFLAQPGQSGLLPSALLHYKLVGVQWKPADKPVPGEDVRYNASQSDEALRYPGVYYLANLMLETSYRLQNYSGQVQSHLPAPNQELGVQDLVTDFDASGRPVKNLQFDGRKPNGDRLGYNMGGCMGCHGQMQAKGYDFNFILRRGRVSRPEMDVSIRLPLIDMVHPREPRQGQGED